jgi:hypothetical protein
VFVAPANPITGAADEAAFVKVGKAPMTLLLPPGVFRLEVEGVGVSRGSLLVTMKGEPKQLLVRSGSEDLGTTGTLFIAVGVTAILGATGILLSGSSAPSSLDKPKVLIPMYAAGAVLLGGGIAMAVAGSTSIDDQTPRRAAPPPQPGFGAGLFLRTSF